ncbi:MAG TPA: hypothetical protein VGW33_10140 [Terriglobia bacterium]|nr:hypothetical protein [Terriglobia bacterium]
MAESRQLEPEAAPQFLGETEPRPGDGAWAKVRLFFRRAVFWSYERGSWQYDIICAVILAFIFLTPRAVFNDRPTLELSDLRHRQGFVEVGHAKDGWHYLIDARLVESLAPMKPEEAAREILRLRLNKPITVNSFEPVVDRNNVVLGYAVVVSQ